MNIHVGEVSSLPAVWLSNKNVIFCSFYSGHSHVTAPKPLLHLCGSLIGFYSKDKHDRKPIACCLKEWSWSFTSLLRQMQECAIATVQLNLPKTP